jgi:branched-chain amino acid transport system substrate-binding protein
MRYRARWLLSKIPIRGSKISLWGLILAVVLAGCTGGQPTKGEVVVYVVGPLSGFQANTGQTVAGGVRLMAEQVNRAGGLLGYEVKVVALDDEADSDAAVAIAEEIRAAVQRGDRVLGVIESPNSSQTAARWKCARTPDHRHHPLRRRWR